MTKQIRLIGVGFRPAIPVKELQAGERFIRNYGFSYKVLRVIPNKSGKSTTFVVEGETKFEKGRILQRNFLNTTYIAKLGLVEVRDERS